MGGTSSEREVSLASGKNISEALASLGKYEVVPIDLTEESLAALPKDVNAVYIALHGGWGESGGVQAALNKLKIPYTGPGVKASEIAMDKIASKRIFEKFGVPTAPWAIATAETTVCPLPLPVVAKPPADGSSVGISKVTRPEEWEPARETVFSCQPRSRPILVEQFIPGREFTVAVVDKEVWPVIEIVAAGGWYGYTEKYTSEETKYPFLEEGELSERLKAAARAAYEAVGCRGVTRVDFRATENGEVYVLELNTSPGFTSHSLVPKAGIRTGLTFAQVCDRILQSADYDR